MFTVERVKESPHYATSGEVRVATLVKKYAFNVFMVPLSMHTTPRYLVWLEGMHISSKCLCLSAYKSYCPFQYAWDCWDCTLSRQEHRLAH